MASASSDRESKLFHNFWKDGKDEEVIKLCKESPEGPFQKCNIYNDTVLHKAIYMQRFDVAHELLDCHVPDIKKLHMKNDWGNTLLHNAAASATYEEHLELITKLLRIAPRLLPVRNRWGETAAFQACRYGMLKAFKLLTQEVDKMCDSDPEYDHDHFFKKDDNTTILHMAILTRNFEMALFIAKKYNYLCHSNDSKIHMTPLQMLACTPTAFKSGTELGSLKEHFYLGVDPGLEGDDGDPKGGVIHKVVSFTLGLCWLPCCKLPLLEEVKKMKRTHKRAEQLAKFLIELDMTWKHGPKPCGELTPWISVAINNKAEDNSDLESGSKRLTRTSNGGIPDTKETPLILAAKYGCVEIVREILHKFPQAMEYLNEDQQTFLHVAVKNRNKEIFYLIEPENYTGVRPQLRAIDIQGNSILHMVALSSTKPRDSKIRSPVLQLSDDLQLLEELKRMCPDCLINHQNGENKTAEELYAENNEQLRSDAKDWLKTTAEHCTVVIVLIATVAFASAYTVPGGPNSQTGYPLLLSKPLFLVFTVADVLSLGFALTAVVIFLSILTSSYQMKEFRKSLPEKLLLGFTLLFLSVSMMMVAFAATIILMINNKERWTKIGVYVVAFFPVCIFIYVILYPTLC